MNYYWIDLIDLLFKTRKLGDDCETSEGQRKACKNCVCGRKEGTSSIPTPQFSQVKNK